MNIIVCIKQVPDTADVKIDPETNTLIREGVEAIINPFDTYAIEEAVRLKARIGGTVTVLTMGPPQAEKALREAISVGADQGVLVSDRVFAGSDTWATSYTLAAAIRKIGDYQLILCGKQAADGDTAQVGPGISVHLDIPQVTYVKKIEEITEKTAKVERMIEEGYEIIETPLPALLTVVKEINDPRLSSIKGLMKSKKVEIITWGVNDLEVVEKKLGLKGSPTQVVKIFTPPKHDKGRMLEGEPQDMVNELTRELDETIRSLV